MYAANMQTTDALDLMFKDYALACGSDVEVGTGATGATGAGTGTGVGVTVVTGITKAVSLLPAKAQRPAALDPVNKDMSRAVSHPAFAINAAAN